MTLVACGLLALGVLAFMISPMLEGSARRPRNSRSAWSAGTRRDELQKKKDFIYSSIRELNIDYNMGKLAAEDHDALRQEYMKEASDVLDLLDRTAGADLSVEEQIEEAVQEIRQTREPAAPVVAPAASVVEPAAPVVESVAAPAVESAIDDKTADDSLPLHSARIHQCGNCNTVNEESANFCIECGASLKPSTCGGCGTENPAPAKFCAQCGEKLS